MIGISRKVENAVVSVLAGQTELESAAVIRGKNAPTHATFPRVVVTCKPGKALFANLPNLISAELELLIQTEAKIDVDGENCEDFADAVFSALQAPHGVPAVNAAGSGMKLDKMEFEGPMDLMKDQGIMNFKLIAELYVS